MNCIGDFNVCTRWGDRRLYFIKNERLIMLRQSCSTQFQHLYD